MPALYVVATPIGNLEDITLRALRVLREVTLIAAEDTRHTRQLLEKYDIKKRLTSYHEHNRFSKIDYILSRLETGDVALVSDAGMPGIADPGYELVAAAVRRGIPVIPVPGPSVVVTALAVAGLPAEKYHYLGFLPSRANQRRYALESVADYAATLVVLETPHRLAAALNDILLVMGDRQIAVCRELTKIHEEVFRGTVSEAIGHFAAPKGEFALIISGKREEPKGELTGEVEQQLRSLHRAGKTARIAIAQVAEETGVTRKKLYQAWLKLASSKLKIQSSKLRVKNKS